MAQAPIGAIITYWLRPTEKRVHIHRIEMEHALYLAAANQEQIKSTLTEVFSRQTASLENISFSLDELRDVIAVGFTEVAEGLSRVDDTLQKGFYQLHLDTLGTHARLDDILFCLEDKEGFQRERARRNAFRLPNTLATLLPVPTRTHSLWPCAPSTRTISAKRVRCSMRRSHC